MSLDTIACRNCTHLRITMDELRRREFVCAVGSEAFPHAEDCRSMNKPALAPVVWVRREVLGRVTQWGATECTLYPHPYDRDDLVPLYVNQTKGSNEC